MTADFLALKTKVSGVISIEYGEKNEKENLEKGLEICFLVTFENTRAREVYLPHPEHVKFGNTHLPIFNPNAGGYVFVFDYNPKKTAI